MLEKRKSDKWRKVCGRQGKASKRKKGEVSTLMMKEEG